jgi:hypothetical protein
MRPVSSQFLEALRGSHKIFARAQILTSFQTGVNPINGIALNIISGSVSLDGEADIRSSFELTTVGGTTAFPQRPVDELTPYGNEIFIERGVELADGSVEIVSLGYFRIDSVEQRNAPFGSVHVVGYDRMKGIIEARLTKPMSFTSGTTISTIFNQLILEVYPQAVIEFDDSSFASSTLNSTQIAEEDRYDFLNNIVTSYGKIMYWDYRGILVVQTPPDPTVSVWDINAGKYGVIVDFRRSIDREGVYNAVVTVGESVNDTPPVRAIAVDNDPTSPTYWYGSFGPKPRFFSSSFITTYEQALGAAENILKKTLGLPFSIEFSIVPNPALEPFDAVTINQLDIISLHVIQTLTIPLDAESTQTGSTRRQADLQLGT